VTGDREAGVPRFHRSDTPSEIRDYRSKRALLPHAGTETEVARQQNYLNAVEGWMGGRLLAEPRKR